MLPRTQMEKVVQCIHKWLRVTKESSAQGKHRREKCRRDDGRVEKRHMTGWTVRKVSQGRKEGSLPIHLPEFKNKMCRVLYSVLSDGLRSKCALIYPDFSSYFWFECAMSCKGSVSKPQALPLFLKVCP